MNDSKVFTIGDAYEERGPIKYAVSDLFALPSVNIVYGAPTSLKSILLLDMSACIVKGVPWLANRHGLPSRPTAKLGVLWIDLDNGIRRTHDRVKAIGNHYGLNQRDCFYYVSMPTGSLDMTDHASLRELEAMILPSIGVVIIDNLSCVVGNTYEDSYEMARVMASFRMLAERRNLAFVILHTGETFRDNLWVQTGVDLALHMRRYSSDNYVIMSSTKSRGNEIAPFGAYFHFEGDATDAKQGWFEGIDADDIELIWEQEYMRHDLLWSYLTSAFVLLYKSGFTDIFPLEEYVSGERMMLQRDSSYKTEWIPIGYGTYGEMIKCKHEIERKGLGAINTKPLDGK
jgi:hypothetical protein